MIVFPPAKINLGLHIHRKRTDGFHAIETVFYPLHSFSDTLEIIPTDKPQYSFQQSGLFIENQKDINLVEKAFLLLQKRYDLPSVDIFLHNTYYIRRLLQMQVFSDRLIVNKRDQPWRFPDACHGEGKETNGNSRYQGIIRERGAFRA